MILDCGHEPTPNASPGTGYATLHSDGRKVCYSCADAIERERMTTADRLFAYLSGDGTAITSWTGGVLARVTSRTPRRVGFHGATRVYIRATDDTGKRWHGSGPGPNMYVRLRATK